jgi:hypothetical protein
MIKIRMKGNLLKDFNTAVEAAKAREIGKMVEALKENTPVDTGNARDHWRAEKDAIVNEVEYIDDLNRGTSEQAPSYFIETTLLTQEGVHPSGTIVRPK